MTKLLILVLALGLFSCGSGSHSSDGQNSLDMSGLEKIESSYSYKSLKILDLDQMTDILREKANDYKKNNRIQALKEGVLIAYSRPDEDVTLEKVISIVKSNLEDIGEWESCARQIVVQSLNTLKNEQTSPVEQVTATVVLENTLSEFKPAFIKQYQSGGFETSIVEMIAQADIRLSSKVESEKRLTQMRTGGSPSQIARKMIDNKNKKLKEIEESQKKK